MNVGASNTTTSDSAKIHLLIQEFYDRYTALESQRKDGLGHVLLSDSLAIEPTLLAALREDRLARRDLSEPREVLNFDPLLASQDPCPKYAVTDIGDSAGKYRVTMRPVCPTPDGQKWQTSRPVVQVEFIGQRWLITNVFYTDTKPPTNLRAILCRFATGDTRPEKRPATCPE